MTIHPARTRIEGAGWGSKKRVCLIARCYAAFESDSRSLQAGFGMVALDHHWWRVKAGRRTRVAPAPRASVDGCPIAMAPMSCPQTRTANGGRLPGRCRSRLGWWWNAPTPGSAAR